MNSDRERETREEAERLALLSVEDQKSIIALHLSVAQNPKVKKRDRDVARKRAEVLARLLKLTVD